MAKKTASKKQTKSKEKSGSITKTMSIGEVVAKYPQTADVFMQSGMHCLGCAISHYENIEQGACAHGIDVDKLIADLNKAIKKK